MTTNSAAQPTAFSPAKIFVGYRLRPIPDVEKWMPEFAAPSNYKDEAKIKDYIEAKKEEFATAAAGLPYLATFEDVCLIDPQSEKALRFEYVDPTSNKQSVAVRVRNYLLKAYPKAWANAAHYDPSRLPGAIFIGFDPRRFLKVLGLECSLPTVDKPCPLRLWYGNADHRDIEEAVCPKDFAPWLNIKTVLKMRRPIDPNAIEHWDTITKDWTEPGHNAQQDAMLSIELATQLGFLSE